MKGDQRLLIQMRSSQAWHFLVKMFLYLSAITILVKCLHDPRAALLSESVSTDQR
jgi:hypothetical protein